MKEGRLCRGKDVRFSCITVVSLPVDIDTNLGDHKETRNVDSPNKNGQKETRLNLRDKLRQDCKTFIHRFDSDRRLHNLNKFRC